MHRPIATAGSIKVTAVYLGDKVRRSDGTPVIHSGGPILRVRVLDCGGDPRLAEAAECEFIGPSDEGDLLRMQQYQFTGIVKEDEWQGRKKYQLHFSSFSRVVPPNRLGITKYLCEATGIGEKTARKLWDTYGVDAVKRLRESPDEAARACSFSVDVAREASEAFKLIQDEEQLTIELEGLFGSHGFPKKTAKNAIKKWKGKAAEVVRRNPYRLMTFPRIGFGKTDALYMALQLPAARLKRQTLCIWNALCKNSDGHTWFPKIVGETSIRQHVGSANKLDPNRAIALGCRANLLGKHVDDFGKVWIAEGAKARTEARLAELVLAAMEEESPWGFIHSEENRKTVAAAFMHLTDSQKQAIQICLNSPIAIFGGSPGTGKTFTAAALIRLIVGLCGTDSVAIAAPTGKAAVRCTEAMAANGIEIKACTIHSLLKVCDANDDGEWGFEHNENNRLPFRFIVIDESSMIDAPLMRSLLAARGHGCGVLFIGDRYQLPPVGYGAPLRDLIAAGIPYGELTVPKRNCGGIVDACAAIKKDEPFMVCDVPEISLTQSTPLNLAHLELVGAEAITKGILSIIRDAKNSPACGKKGDEVRPLNPTWDIQVIVAVKKKSALGRDALNKILQAELNPNGERVDSSPFRVNDKVLQTKNQKYDLVDEDNKPTKRTCFVANGEFGKVVAVEPTKTIVEFSTGDSVRRVVIHRMKGAKADPNDENEESSTGCNLELGYAVTCHKMQGSQCPVVIVVLDDYTGASGEYGVAKREWLYTAISRAERLCYLVGQMQTATTIVRYESLSNRKTFLREAIEAGRLWGERVWGTGINNERGAVEA